MSGDERSRFYSGPISFSMSRLCALQVGSNYFWTANDNLQFVAWNYNKLDLHLV